MNELTMEQTGYTAAEQPTQAASTSLWWVVVDAYNRTPMFCNSPAVAAAQCVIWDDKYPTLAPHRVVRMVEQTALQS